PRPGETGGAARGRATGNCPGCGRGGGRAPPLWYFCPTLFVLWHRTDLYAPAPTKAQELGGEPQRLVGTEFLGPEPFSVVRGRRAPQPSVYPVVCALLCPACPARLDPGAGAPPRSAPPLDAPAGPGLAPVASSARRAAALYPACRPRRYHPLLGRAVESRPAVRPSLCVGHCPYSVPTAGNSSSLL